MLTAKTIYSEPILYAMAQKQYTRRQCVMCGTEYRPKSGHSKCCSAICATEYRNRKLQEWRAEHTEHIKRYGIKTREKQNSSRRLRRRKIQTQWGYVGGEKGTYRNNHWQEAEEYAAKIMEGLGFANVHRLIYFPTSPFDIRAEKNGKCCVVAVTCRTHIDDLKRHIRLADDLFLDFYILYVKPDLSGHIFKKAKEKGASELKYKETMEVSKLK